jgi:N-acetylglucosaminyldiphosphoundecaprenol N-acetyl-beta-D-mannosaminyltransferase
MNPTAKVDERENTPLIAVTERRTTGRVLGSRIDTLTWETALGRIFLWARARTSHYVCMCNVHGVVSAAAETGLRKAINGADMATPDGKPVAVALALQGFRGQSRISGPELMWKCCEQAAESGVHIFLYGSTSENLSVLIESLKASFPKLKIADAYAPPFRQLTDEEDADVVRRINKSGAGLVFVGLGCPKQELWMAEHKGRIHAVMIGVGAAFDFHSGKVQRAPHWMQDLGLEWLSRLIREPRRLWRRYLVTNSIFLTYILLRTPSWILLRRARMTSTSPPEQESRTYT